MNLYLYIEKIMKSSFYIPFLLMRKEKKYYNKVVKFKKSEDVVTFASSDDTFSYIKLLKYNLFIL